MVQRLDGENGWIDEPWLHSIEEAEEEYEKKGESPKLREYPYFDMAGESRVHA